jgi:hypothetical protein
MLLSEGAYFILELGNVYGKLQHTADYLAAAWHLREGERVIAVLAAKARMARRFARRKNALKAKSIRTPTFCKT